MIRRVILVVLLILGLPLMASAQASWSKPPGVANPTGTRICGALSKSNPRCFHIFTAAADPVILEISPECSGRLQLMNPSGGAALNLYGCQTSGAFSSASCNITFPLSFADTAGVPHTKIDGLTAGELEFTGISAGFLGVDVTAGAGSLMAQCVSSR